MRRTTFLVLIAIGLTGSAHGAAGDAGRESPLSVGLGARPLGIGGAYSALSSDPSATYYNPAGLAWLQFQQVSTMYMQMLEESALNYGAWAVPTPSYGGFGLLYARVGADELVRRVDFVDQGTFGYAHTLVQAGYGRTLVPGLAAGISIKAVRESIDDFTDNGIGADVGLLAKPFPHIFAGASAQNVLPSKLRLRDQEQSELRSYRAGLALVHLPVGNEIDLTLAGDGRKVEGGSMQVYAGGEVRFNQTFSLRGGYDRDNVTFGAGVVIRRISIDYAYKILEDVDGSHRISLGATFGPSIDAQLASRAQKRALEGTRLIEGDRQQQFVFFKERADIFYETFELDSALQYYQRSLAFSPENQEIIGTIAAIQEAVRTREMREQQMREVERTRALSVGATLSQTEALIRANQPVAAREVLSRLEPSDTSLAIVRDLRSRIDIEISREYARAIEAAEEAVRRDDLVEAIEQYSQAVRMNPLSEEAKRGRERIVTDLGRAQLITSALELYRAGKYLEARDRFMRVLEQDSSHPIAIDYVGRIDRALAQPPTLEELQQDREIWPIYLEGLRLMRERQYREAISTWEKVLEKYPNNRNTIDNIEQARLRLRSEEGK